MKPTIEIAAFAAAVLVAALAAHAWLASRDDQRRLQATLDAQQKVVSEAVVREGARDASLASALSQIAKLKAAAQTPQEIVANLPKYLALPQPITLAGEPSQSFLTSQGDPNSQILRTKDYAASSQAPARQGTDGQASPNNLAASPTIAPGYPGKGILSPENAGVVHRL